MAKEKTSPLFWVFSTLTASQAYQADAQRGESWIKEGPEIIIQGGHGLTVRNSQGAILTPRGVSTRVTADELEWLKKCSAFNAHVKAGKITVESSEIDAEKVAADMECHNGDAQLSLADLGGQMTREGRITVKTDPAESLVPA